ncbi:MAG TPA: M1 family aminopeptidase [Thermoanaerobaculia bacterium]|nr:M1 family aminopeptidase [Thermoanaerobaculia bacterium]
MTRGIRLFTVALAALVTMSLQAQQTVASLAELFDNLKVGDSTSVPASTVFRQGNIEFTLAGGSAAPVLAGKDQIGWFYKGRGSYVYRVVDKDEVVVAASNAKRGASLNFDEKNATINDGFDRAFFWVAGAPMPNLGGTAGGESLTAAFDEHQKFFQRDVSTPAVHQAILQRLNAPKKTLFRAELAGGSEDSVYVFDEADRETESLYVLQRGSGRIARNMAFGTPISEHPIARPLRKGPQPRFQLTDINYTLQGDGINGSITMTQTYTGFRPGITALRLDQIDTLYDDNAVERHIRVKSAKDEKGNELSIDHRKDELIVGLPAPLQPNATAKVTYELEGDFLLRPSGDSFWQLGLIPWFPQPDLVEQYYTVHSTVKVKKPFVAFAPGKTVRRGEEGDFNVVENMIDKPVQFAVVHAGKYYAEEETRNGITIRVASYAGKNSRASKTLTNLAFGIIEHYQFFLGPFPFPELNIIQINELGYGQAPPGTMFITNEAFNPTMGEFNQLFSQGINERFAHEIAHQYWGHVVKMPSGEEQWMTESFAEYSAAVFLKKLKKDGTYESLIRHWQKNASDASKYASVMTANRIRIKGDGYSQVVARTGLMYDKGAYLLAALHKELGDQLFLSFLKSYQTNFRWKYGSSESVGALLQFITKKDYSQFLDDYFYGTKMPTVSLK